MKFYLSTRSKLASFTGLLLLIFGTVIVIYQWTTILKPIHCRKILNALFLNANFSTITQENELLWINETFKFRWLTQETRFPSELKTSYIVFQDVEYKYRLMIAGNHYELQQDWNYSNVYLGDLLRCFGEPDFYLNIQEFVIHSYFQTTFFFYSDLGVAFRGAWYFETEPEKIGNDMLIWNAIRFLETSIDDQLNTLFYEEHESAKMQIIDSVKVWPTDQNDIDLEPITIEK